MRHRQAATLALGLALAVTACDNDFLLTVPPTSVSDAIFWQQEKDAVLAVTALYPLHNAPDVVIAMESAGDNSFAQKSFHAWYPVGRGTLNSSSAPPSTVWNNAYTAIRRANEVLANIDRIPEMDAGLRDRLKGETYFHRAYHYNLLAHLYGGVPLVLEPLTLAESRELTRASREQVIQQVLSDLDLAIPALPTAYGAADRGRATQGAALALKARAAIWAAGWAQNHQGDQGAANGFYAQAADAAQAVIDLGVYSLHPSYADLTRYAGNNSSEIIHADMRLPNQRGHGAFAWLGPSSFQGGNDYVPLRGLVDAYRMTDGLPISQSPLFDPGDPYENRDPRMSATLLFPGATFGGTVYNSLPNSPTDDRVQKDFNTTSTGFNFIKYVDLDDRDDRGNSGVHFILIRYADVLLMYAEAKLELDQIDGSVLDAINQVRSRAGMPAVGAGLSQAEMRDVVRYERHAEFAGEGLRLFDIRRWKIAEDVMPGPQLGIDYIDEQGRPQTIPADTRLFNAARDYLWPIPVTEIERNANLTQNPGY